MSDRSAPARAAARVGRNFLLLAIMPGLFACFVYLGAGGWTSISVSFTVAAAVLVGVAAFAFWVSHERTREARLASRVVVEPAPPAPPTRPVPPPAPAPEVDLTPPPPPPVKRARPAAAPPAVPPPADWQPPPATWAPVGDPPAVAEPAPEPPAEVKPTTPAEPLRNRTTAPGKRTTARRATGANKFFNGPTQPQDPPAGEQQPTGEGG